MKAGSFVGRDTGLGWPGTPAVQTPRPGAAGVARDTGVGWPAGRETLGVDTAAPPPDLPDLVVSRETEVIAAPERDEAGPTRMPRRRGCSGAIDGPTARSGAQAGDTGAVL